MKKESTVIYIEKKIQAPPQKHGDLMPRIYAELYMNK